MAKYKEIPKVWGKEIWLVNRDYCGKKLVLNKGFRCSMHYHKNKDETFYILKGKVLMETDKETKVMTEGDSILITPGMKHRFTGLENSEIMEFSTHHEDSDSYRTEPSGEVDLSKLNLSETKKATCLVTGGAGFIGSHVCDALLAAGNYVVCVDNFDSYYNPKVKEKNIEEASKNDNFVLYKTDITNKEELRKVFEENKIDKVIHLAAKTGVRDSFDNPKLYEKVNVEGTRNLLELAKEFKIKNFIFGSSSSVYGTNKKAPFSENDSIENTISPYANTKKRAEGLCKEYHNKFGLKLTCLRFFTVYGPRGRPDMATYKFTEQIMEGKPIEMYGDGTSKRDYTYVKDIVDGILSALNKNFDFEIINLGNSNAISLKAFISLIEREVKRKTVVKKSPVQEGDVPLTYADISKARKLLDYEPKIKIKEGIRLFVDWYSSRK